MYARWTNQNSSGTLHSASLTPSTGTHFVHLWHFPSLMTPRSFLSRFVLDTVLNDVGGENGRPVRGDRPGKCVSIMYEEVKKRLDHFYHEHIACGSWNRRQQGAYMRSTNTYLYAETFIANQAFLSSPPRSRGSIQIGQSPSLLDPEPLTNLGV
jgi:hypothetical protein